MSAQVGTGPVVWRDRHRLTMDDVDAAGIVFYANPYRWRDTVYTGWLLSIGHPLSKLLDSGFATPCVASSARYLAPLRLDDVVDLSLAVERVGTSSFDLRMDAAIGGQGLAVEVRTTNVWAARKPEGGLSAQPLPDWLVEELSAANPIRLRSTPSDASARLSADDISFPSRPGGST